MTSPGTPPTTRLRRTSRQGILEKDCTVKFADNSSTPIRWSWSTATLPLMSEDAGSGVKVDASTSSARSPQGRRRQDAPQEFTAEERKIAQRVAQAARAQASGGPQRHFASKITGKVSPRKGALVGIAPVANTAFWVRRRTPAGTAPPARGPRRSTRRGSALRGGRRAWWPVCDQPRDPGPVAADPVLVRRRHRPCHPARVP